MGGRDAREFSCEEGERGGGVRLGVLVEGRKGKGWINGWEERGGGEGYQRRPPERMGVVRNIGGVFFGGLGGWMSCRK